PTYFTGPMDQLPKEVDVTLENPTVTIGVYDANYIGPSLKGYFENKDIIGEEFKIWYLSYSGCKITKSKWCVDFNIDDWESVLPVLQTMRDDPNFLAYSILTNNKFISSYYDSEKLLDMMNGIFGDNLKGVTSVGKRYVMTVVGYGDRDGDKKTLVTTLNNVIGNIPYDCQINSLLAIRSLCNS
ncbi:MAG: hypothetical protein GTN36_05350, partial [Candidatus Aenigmarchaeota archaeon]|nr:hypothetical protein [Candidatus Aenigmarchaeota archaeon]